MAYEILHGLELIGVLRADEHDLLIAVEHIREVHGLFSLLIGGHTGHHQIKVALSQTDEQAVKAHIHNLQLHAHLIRKILGDGNVEAHDGVFPVHLRMELIGWVVRGGADHQLPLLLDLIQCGGRRILLAGAGRQGQTG